MAFWDDVFRTFSGGEPEKDKPSSSPAPRRAPAREVDRSSQPNVKTSPRVSKTTAAVEGFRAGANPTNTEKWNQIWENRYENADKSPSGSSWETLGNQYREATTPSSSLPKKDTPTVRVSGTEVPTGRPTYYGAGIETQKQNKDIITEQDERKSFAQRFQTPGRREVRELSQEEWRALSPEQQQGVIANFALYQASLADHKAGLDKGGDADYETQVKDAFGEAGGSDTYAPNTMRVLSELGYKNDRADLDLFLDGSAIATYEDILGTSKAPARQDVFEELSSSAIFQNESLTAALNNGVALMDALQTTNTVSPEFLQRGGVAPRAASMIPEDRQEALLNVLQGMTKRYVWDSIQKDPELNEALQADLAEVTAGLDPTLVAQFFDETYRGAEGDEAFMSYEEFAQNWLKRE